MENVEQWIFYDNSIFGGQMANIMRTFLFLPCPLCGKQTDTKVLPETVLVRYPLFCAQCRQETLVDVVKMRMVLSDDIDVHSGVSNSQHKE